MNVQLVKSDELLKEAFKNLKCRQDVAQILEITDSTLIYYLYRRKDNYAEFIINKKSGGKREINVPISPLKILQRKLLRILFLIYRPRPSVTGFCHGRNILENARRHNKKRLILNLDLKNFFKSINFGRVRGMFMASPYNLPAEAATILAQICCYKNELPQGAPTSPIVSNMICSKLDGELQRLAKKYKCTYTRYADDISFSTNRKGFDKAIAICSYDDGVGAPKIVIGELLEDLIVSNGFRLNESKIRFQSQSIRQEVTGLVVNEKVNIRRKFIRQIRAILHAAEKFTIEKAAEEHFSKYDKKQRIFGIVPKFEDIVKGKINFVKMIRGQRDPLYRGFLNRFNRLMNKNTPELPTDVMGQINSCIWVVNCGTKEGTGFLLENNQFITCAHVVEDAFKDEEKQDIFVWRQNDFPRASRKRAILISFNREKDFAILGLERGTNEFERLKVGDSDKIFPGMRLTIFGFPNYRPGDGPAPLECKVRTVRSSGRIVIDKFIQSGESGAPALNSQNQVVAIAVTGIRRREDLAGNDLEFALIPINSLKQNGEKAELVVR